jgi:hypothetical protein
MIQKQPLHTNYTILSHVMGPSSHEPTSFEWVCNVDDFFMSTREDMALFGKYVYRTE